MEYNWYDYGGKIADGGNANSYNGSNIASGGTAGSRMTLKTTFEPLEGELTKAFYGSNSTDSGAHIDFYLQELDGNYTKKDTVYIGGPNGVTTFSINDKYSGFHAAQYKQDVYVSGGRYYIDNNPAWKNVGDKNETTGYYGSSVDFYQELGIRYDRTEYKFTYFTNNASSQIVERPVKFEASLAGYGDQNPGQNTGFYFDGWYADDAFSKRAFFDQASYDASPLTTEEKVLLDKMPDHNETVYGHWLLERSRAVIVPGASDVDIGSQALSFRLDYGETISGSLLESAKRLGYVLDGWYTDPEFTNRFIFSTPVISGIRGVYSDYQTATRWNAARILYHDDDEAHANVRNIITLYAKWVIDTNARGIKVLYDAGDAAVYDTTGTLTTSIPVDSHLYQRNQNEVAVVAAPPTGYSDKYVFDYWVAVDADGNQVTMYDNEGNPISQLQTGTVFAVDLTEDAYFEKTTNPNNPADTLLRIIKLKAQYHLSDQANKYTTITYDGNEFTRDRYPSGTVTVHGKTKDGQDQISLTLDTKVNDSVILPGEDDFYLEGYRLVGWSFFRGTYEEQEQQLTAYNNDPGTLPGDRLTSFTPHQKVAADKLDQGAVNTKANTLYAMWLPKYYTVTVKQVIEEGVQANSFDYRYRAGVENAMPSAYLTQNLSGNAQASFTTFTANTAKKLEYYDRVGHVFQIVTPTIAANADYTVRVTAYADLDNGSRVVIDPETVNAKISGTNYSFSSYQIDGDITITYTYVLKVDVKLVKMNLQTNTNLSGSVFTLTPVEWDRNTSSWLKIGDPTVFTLNNTSRIKMLEGTYRVDETTVPANFAPLGVQLLLTVKNSEDFTLTLMNGGAVSSRIASLSSTTGTDGDNGGGKKHTLTLFDRPLRTITVNKLVTGTEATPGMTYPFTARVTLEGAALADFNTGADTTNGAGYITFRLAKGESRTITIPWGSVITLAENTLPAGYYLQSVQIPSTVTDTDAADNVVSFTADADTAVTFTNIRPICRIIDGGAEHVFVTLRDAVSYAETSMGGTATIEMLVDYDMPASDTVTVAASDSITLTTAPKTGYTYNYIGSGDVAAITRGFDGGSLFTVAGALTTESITLDGGNTAFTPLSCNANGGIINSTGSVTVNADTILRNSKAANGGAIYASAGYLNIGEVGILDCYATQDGGAIYVTGSTEAGENGLVIDGHSSLTLTGTAAENKQQIQNAPSNARDGGGIYVDTGASFTFTGGELMKCKASGNGGAIYNAGTIAMTEKTSSQESNQLKRGSLEYCSAANGGAIYNTGAGTVDMTGGYIEHCMATGNGAGIYLPEGSTLNISGSPSFGGTAATDGNHIGTGTNAKREDIYIAGYLGTKGGDGTDKDDPKLADSLIVTGKLYGSLTTEQAKGQIWVGAQQQDNEDNNHWDTLKQFAKFADALMTGTGDTMKIDDSKLSESDVEKIYAAFRNATLTDETYGMTGDGQTGGIQCIYWEGVQGSRKVVLRKVEDSTYESIQGAVFDVYKGNSTKVFVLKDKNKIKPDETLRDLDSKASGVFWVGELPYGVYYLHETTVPSGYTGYGTSEGRWFYLVIGDDTVAGSRDGVVMSEGYETRDEAKAAYDSY